MRTGTGAIGVALACALLCSLFVSTARAGETGLRQGFFYAGAGGSFNWSQFDQALQGVSGITEVVIGPQVLAEGQAGGPYFNFDRDESGFAPDFQAGYIAPLGGAWQGGLKFTYRYANIDSSESVSIPQAGSVSTLPPLPPDTIDFTGFVPIRKAEMELKHQFAFLATIGRTYGKTMLYAGAGPALFGTETKFIDAMCFATINGNLINVCGASYSYRSEDWVWGGAAQIGATYELGPRWFLDLNYTFARSRKFKLSYAIDFDNDTGVATSEGSGTLNARQQITNQAVALTVNRRF
ncbi:MAG: hypothetical protein FJX44_11840 [Alphaproteobacteria bacterium]|nr:hypothetical protein [Alphaproteobacteria bacterium]